MDWIEVVGRYPKECGPFELIIRIVSKCDEARPGLDMAAVAAEGRGPGSRLVARRVGAAHRGVAGRVGSRGTERIQMDVA